MHSQKYIKNKLIQKDQSPKNKNNTRSYLNNGLINKTAVVKVSTLYTYVKISSDIVDSIV